MISASENVNSVNEEEILASEKKILSNQIKFTLIKRPL